MENEDERDRTSKILLFLLVVVARLLGIVSWWVWFLSSEPETNLVWVLIISSLTAGALVVEGTLSQTGDMFGVLDASFRKRTRLLYSRGSSLLLVVQLLSCSS
jgi:hypothetical protein